MILANGLVMDEEFQLRKLDLRIGRRNNKC